MFYRLQNISAIIFDFWDEVCCGKSATEKNQVSATDVFFSRVVSGCKNVSFGLGRDFFCEPTFLWNIMT